MSGGFIGFAKYRDGHASIGPTVIRSRLVAYPTNLSVEDDAGKPLFSIPWGNFVDAHPSILTKEGVASGASTLFSTIPILNLTNASTPYFIGFRIDYWDEEIQREQDVFFECGSDRKADDMVRKLFAYRDTFYRTLGNQGRPKTR